MSECRTRIVASVLTVLLATPGWGQEGAATVMTLDAFVKRAIAEGVRGRQNALALEQAGYTKNVALRQTDSPIFEAGHSNTRTGTRVGDSETITDTNETDVTMTQLLPLGTQIDLRGVYSDTTGTSADNKPGFSASAVQPVYVFVRNAVLRQRRRARLSYEDAEATFEATKLDIRSSARTLYYLVMLAEESIKVEQRKVNSARKLLDISQAMVEAGKTAPVETMRAKLRLLAAERQLANVITQKLQAEINAKNFLFMPLDEKVQFVTQLEFSPLKPSLGRLVEYALLHRPRLQNLRRAKEFRMLDLQAAREVTRPTLSLNSRYDYQKTPSVVSKTWQLGWSANWRFFDSFITRDNVRNAFIETTLADIDLADAERSTRVDVYNAYLDVRRTEKQIQDFKVTREQAVRNVDVLRLRFQNGLDRLIDVFQSEDDMRNLENEYLGLLVTFNQSKDQLSTLIGADVETIQ